MKTPPAILALRGATFLCLAVLPAVLVVFALRAGAAHGSQPSDFGAFWNAGRDVLAGHSPYVTSLPRVAAPATFAPFVYPAPAAVAMVPFALLPYGVASWLWALLACAAIAGSLRLLGVRDWRCYGAAFLALPTASALTLGTFSPFLLLAAAVAWRWRDRAAIAGAAVGLVVVAKLFLWPLVVWQLATRRWRAAAVSCVVGGVTTAAAWGAIGFAGLRGYPHLLSALTRLVGHRSFSAYALERSLGIGGGIAQLVPVTCAVALVLALRKRDDAIVYTAAVAATLLATPILWSHYLLLLFAPLAVALPRFGIAWLVPSLLWLDAAGWSEGRRGRIAFELGVAAAVLLAPYAASAARTSSAWVSGFTFRITRLTVPSAPITNVERSTPM